jgi:putative flippase GtrA
VTTPLRRGVERPLRLGPRLARFLAVGATGAVVNLGALWALAGILGVPDVLASAAAIEASIVWNFALNSAFTYRDRTAAASAGVAGRFVRYNLVSLVGLAVQLITFVAVRALALRAMHGQAPDGLRYVAQSAGIVLATAWSFAGNLHFTFRQAPARGGAA